MNTLPREIDFLIIRKKAGIFKHELSSFFGKCNIWEFKGYRGRLDLDVYHKAMSYAYEYLLIDKELDGIQDITLSFLREGWPLKLMKRLSSDGYEIQSSPGWVARYKRDGYPPLQIVNIAHPEAPPVLRLISHKATPEDINNASGYISSLPEEEKDKARIVVELSYRINKEVVGGMEMGGFFETYVDPLNKIIEQKDAEIEQKDAEMKQKDTLINRLKDEIKRLGGSVAAL